MDDHKKKRLIILAVSGLLLGAGVFGYYQYHENKNANEVEEMPPVISVRRPVIKPTITGATATTTDAATGTAVVQPAVAITAGNPTIPTSKQAAVITQTPVVTQESPVKPAVAISTQQQPAVKPVIAQPPQVVTATPVVVQQPTVVTPQIVAQQPNVPVTGVNAIAPSMPANPKQYPATNGTAASGVAKVGAGRLDPAEPILSFLPFPHVQSHSADSLLALVPPPPSDKPIKLAAKTINERLVPPPPPMEATPTGGIAGLPIDQLPVPPSRPTIGDKLRVLGVMDDKAIISFPKAMASKNKWPKSITLGTGEQFESLTIVSITRDGITIEEDGERTMKPISTIK